MSGAAAETKAREEGALEGNQGHQPWYLGEVGEGEVSQYVVVLMFVCLCATLYLFLRHMSSGII
jgi:hypothetical protein